MHFFKVRKTRFQADNGFVILVCDEIDEKEKKVEKDIVVVGNSLPTIKDTIFEAEAELVNSKYGEQYKVSSFKVRDPKGKQAIYNMLIALHLKGLGKTRCKKIVEAFGKDTLKVLDEDFDRIKNIRGIPKNLHKAREQYKNSRSLRDLIEMLSGVGNIGFEKLQTITRVIGDNAAEELKYNPYLLCEIKGIRFHTAEQLAMQSMDYDPCRRERVESAIKDVLFQDTINGNVFTLSNKLISDASALLNQTSEVVPTEVIAEACNNLFKTEQLKAIKLKGGLGAVYLNRLYEYEVDSADIVADRIKRKSYKKNEEKAKSSILSFEKDNNFSLAEKQKEAVVKAVTNPISIITGGPGRGKTTVLNAILHTYKQIRKNATATLLAPSGKAARRMAEATGCETSTIHSALQIRTSDEEVYEDVSLNTDLLIVDEVSMVDMELFYKLIKASKNVQHMILVGDVNQLPSIGAGDVLSELISSNRIPTTVLDKSFRFGESLIYQNSENINEGKDELLEGEDFVFIEGSNQEQIRNEIVKVYEKEMKNGLTVDDISVLTPFRNNTLIGANALNEVISNVVNTMPEQTVFGRKLKVGDKVMQTLNLSEEGISNGDIGYVERINKGSNNDTSVLVNFIEIGKKKLYESRDEFQHLDLAYATTIHKSQGSEYPVVIIPMSMVFSRMLKRNLLYTAVTRAKKRVYIIGDKRAVSKAVCDNSYVARNTLFAWKIQSIYDAYFDTSNQKVEVRKNMPQQLSFF